MHNSEVTIVSSQVCAQEADVSVVVMKMTQDKVPWSLQQRSRQPAPVMSPHVSGVAGPHTAANATCTVGGPQWPRCHCQSGLYA